jgi:hypothetical protein
MLGRMSPRPDPRRAGLALVVLVALVAVVAIPALAASTRSPGAAAITAANATASEKPGKGAKASKEPEVSVTLRGAVAATKDAEGHTTYTITVDGRTVGLDAGPSWFFGDKHPLAPFVGKTVTVTGEQSGDEVDVETVDGVRLREPGKPPWAGGWKVVGSAHPGWSQEKWDRWQQHQADKGAKSGAAGAPPGAPGCWPPGQCKDHGPKGSDDPADASDDAAGG